MEREIVNWPTSSRAIETRLTDRVTPALFAETDQAQRRFWEFFGGSIWNRNTRLAYVTAAYRFADWCEGVDTYTECALQTNKMTAAREAQQSLKGLFEKRRVIEPVVESIKRRIAEMK